ncbi:MAG TPA: PilZ domain-containing protein [Clostridia bacterium]|nr:PilZ domain-containing protein [Clostridia bacterium]
MEERRKSKRLPLKLELNISSLFKQDYELIPGVNESIAVKDISKTGIGFTCRHALPLDYYFDAKIKLTSDKYFYAVLKIVRISRYEDGYSVGCEFVGLADILSMKVDWYGEELEETAE